MRLLPVAMLLATLPLGCTPANPASGGSPVPGASAKPAAGPSASSSAAPAAQPSGVAPSASGSPAASASAGPAPGPVVANTGKFVWKTGMSATYQRFEKGAMAGQETTKATFKITGESGGKLSYEVLRQAPGAASAAVVASGSYDPKYDPYSIFVDVNLNPVLAPDVVASAQGLGEETITVPAGTFACTKTRYNKERVTVPGMTALVDITLWTNGTVDLVKAQVSNTLTTQGGSQTSDIRYELETKPQ